MNTSIHNKASVAVSASEGTSSRALASLLLAAGVAALVVLADQLLDSWAERHEVAAWLVLWGIAVAAIALLRGVSRYAARNTVAGGSGKTLHITESSCATTDSSPTDAKTACADSAASSVCIRRCTGGGAI